MNSLDTKIVFHDSWVITNVALIRKYVAKILSYNSHHIFHLTLFSISFLLATHLEITYGQYFGLTVKSYH